MTSVDAPPRNAPAAPSSTRVSKIVRSTFLHATLVGLLAFVALSARIDTSPDTVYDEAVYTAAAQNVAKDGLLTWRGDPIFVHPPLYFLTQAGWLKIRGSDRAPLFDAISDARLLTAAFGALSVALLFLLTLEMTSGAGPRRSVLLALIAALIAVFDPVFMRYSRIGMIESAATAMSLLTLLAAWRLRGTRSRTWIGTVGLLTGLSLLVKEITIFIVMVPLVYSLLQRSGRDARRAVSALGVGFVFWLSLPAWALLLGLQTRFFEEKFRTLERLLGFLQVTGWNRPTVSFLDAVRISAPEYLSSYVLLAAGGLALVWLWLSRGNERGTFLVAWLGCAFAFGGYTVTRGQLNEQFFMYLIPPAIIGTVALADAAYASFAYRHDPRRRVFRGIPIALLAGIVAFGANNAWSRYYTGEDRGISRVVAFAQVNLSACSVVNASGDLQKYALALGGGKVVGYASGPRALSRGVRYFFLNPKDAFARYGKMSPDFADWIRSNGTRLAQFPSRTYWATELWYVDRGPFDPIADLQPVAGGVFVNASGSACGGYRILDDGRGAFRREYFRLGGKLLLGRPASKTWTAGRQTFQAFDAMLLASDRGGPVRAQPVVADIARRSPAAFGIALPRPVSPDRPTVEQASRYMRNPDIAAFFFGGSSRNVTLPRWQSAASRWGWPIGPPVAMPDGWVRQPFERAVLEVQVGSRKVQPGVIAPALVRAGIIPRPALATEPVPNLAVRVDPVLPSRVWPFALTFLAVFVLWAVLFGRRRAPVLSGDTR